MDEEKETGNFAGPDSERAQTHGHRRRPHTRKDHIDSGDESRRSAQSGKVARQRWNHYRQQAQRTGERERDARRLPVPGDDHRGGKNSPGGDHARESGKLRVRKVEVVGVAPHEQIVKDGTNRPRDVNGIRR